MSHWLHGNKRPLSIHLSQISIHWNWWYSLGNEGKQWQSFLRNTLLKKHILMAEIIMTTILQARRQISYSHWKKILHIIFLVTQSCMHLHACEGKLHVIQCLLQITRVWMNKNARKTSSFQEIKWNKIHFLLKKYKTLSFLWQPVLNDCLEKFIDEVEKW